MIEIIIKKIDEDCKLLINTKYIIYVDMVENEVLCIYIHNRTYLELTNNLLRNMTINDLYKRIKMVMSKG